MIPWFVRYGTYPFHQLKTGRQTLTWYQHFRESQFWPLEKLKRWQEEKLRELLDYAARHVPFYSESFRSNGINLKNQSIWEIWNRIPILTKNGLRENFDRMRSSHYSGHTLTVETSGSTGQPLSLEVDRLSEDIHEAIKWRGRSWWGLQIGDRQVWLWGEDESIGGGKKALRDLFVLNKRVLRIMSLSEKTADEYFYHLQCWKPNFLYGYPSGFKLLILMARKREFLLARLHLKGIITTAEVLTTSQRELFQETFDCPVINEYGSAETQVIAFECPSRNMHLSADALLVEFLQDGRPVELGKPGHIVITDLFNRAMPLIRYQIGDLGSPKAGNCPCGRTLPLMDIAIGREIAMIRLPDGRLIHPEIFTPPHRNPIPDVLFTHVEQFRIIQEAPNAFRIQVIAGDSHMDRIRNRFLELAEKHLGKGYQIVVERVSHIPRDPSGKMRYFISKLEPQFDAGVQG